MPITAVRAMVLRTHPRDGQQQATTNKTKPLILLEISNNPGQIGAHSTTARLKRPHKSSGSGSRRSFQRRFALHLPGCGVCLSRIEAANRLFHGSSESGL